MTTVALKALAALLSYPVADLRAALPEIRAALRAERRIARADRVGLDALIEELQREELIDSQERYVALFDRGRATSLNLYEHIHGDSRDRGQAMVDLAQTYARGGLRLATRELPDHVPVILEYLSTRPFAEAEEMLADCAHLLRKIGEALVQRGSHYAAGLGTLLALAGEAPLASLPARVADAEEDARALDKEWIEAPVLFGLGCGDARDNAGGAQPVRFVRRTA